MTDTAPTPNPRDLVKRLREAAARKWPGAEPAERHSLFSQAADAIEALAHPAPAEPTRSQKLAAAGFTPRDTRIACDECGQPCTPQMLPIHKCAPAEPAEPDEPVAHEVMMCPNSACGWMGKCLKPGECHSGPGAWATSSAAPPQPVQPPATAQPVQAPPGWVPVTERLPDSGKVVLACYTNRAGRVRRIRAEWVAEKSREANSDDSDISGYDEATDTFYVPPGWYEKIDNWGDYSSVAVCEGEVTHWMPLPAAPDAPAPAKEQP